MSETLDPECLQQTEGINATLIERTLLRQLSPRDKKWDDRRAESDRVKELYSGTIYDALADRIEGCSGRLEFGYDLDSDGKQQLRLRKARFCRVRHCSVCQWRRSLMWRAKALKVLPKVVEKYFGYRFIQLTLTVRNCPISELRTTIGAMNQAFSRMTKRKKFPAVGWIRSLEVTRSQDGEAHPHFHCLLMVRPSYFSGNYYLNQEEWTELWRESARLNYPPMVYVQVVKPKQKSDQTMLEAICETLKYQVKPDDLIGDSTKEITEKDRDWLVELTAQLYKIRAIATGGILKEYLRELENEPEDLIHADDNNQDENDSHIATVTFDWEQRPQKYVMADDDY